MTVALRSAAVVAAPGFRTEPYWWDAAPRRDEPARPLPAQTEVVVVGSGYTGLSAALTLARGGRDVTILERESVGWGASSRNFGLLGRQYKRDFTDLLARFGADRARALFEGANRAFEFVNDLIAREKIDCLAAPSGRFVASNTPAQLAALERELAARAEHFGHAYRMVDKAGVRDELGADGFAGGAVIPEHRTIHPGLFHDGFAMRVREAGAALHSRTAVLAIRRSGEGWSVETDRGTIRSRHLVAATNGYTGPATPWLRRRIVPIRAYMIATEPLEPDVLQRLLPTRRAFHDSARDMQYARVSPDGSRLLFGAMTGEVHDDLGAVAASLHVRMTRLFPELSRVRLSHVWTGCCGGTFDHFPHRGRHEGMHFAMGYCFGAGMPFGTWLGDAIGRSILGEAAVTPLDEPEMPAHPLYRGKAWFLPFYLRYLKLLDWKDGVRT